MRLTAFVLAAGLLAAVSLPANNITEGEALAKKSDCFACHQPTRKVVGPAYVDVAKKYKGQPGAVAALVKKVKAGGSGVWGNVPMTPHPTLSDADVTKMVEWILAGAPSAASAAAPTTVPTSAVTSEPKSESQAAQSSAEADGLPQRRKKKRHSFVHAEVKEKLAWGTDEDLRELLEKQDCMGCHSGTNSLGEAEAKPWPSFKQIAEKYRKGADTTALVKKVKANEGGLRWGKIPHPTYPQLPEEAVRAAVDFVLAGKAVEAPKAAAGGAVLGEAWMRTRSDCFSCHQVAQKVVGPAYRDVAKKYTEKDIPYLVKKVREGGSGVWGNVPMTAHANATDEQLESAVRWILAQK
jgi:cytochrome c